MIYVPDAFDAGCGHGSDTFWLAARDGGSPRSTSPHLPWHMAGRRPYLRLGQGPRLVVASPLTSAHANPTGVPRRTSLASAAPFAEHFTVYLVNRRPGLASATVRNIAADYAAAIEQDLGRGPGDLLLYGAIRRPTIRQVAHQVVKSQTLKRPGRQQAIQAVH